MSKDFIKEGMVEVKFNLKDPIENKLYYTLADHNAIRISHIIIESLKNYLLYNKDEANNKLINIVNNLSGLLNQGNFKQPISTPVSLETKKISFEPEPIILAVEVKEPIKAVEVKKPIIKSEIDKDKINIEFAGYDESIQDSDEPSADDILSMACDGASL